MIIDFEKSTIQNSKFDVCIVGGGFAGISIAKKLDKNLKVCLLEGGGYSPTAESQKIYDGKVIGDNYFPLVAARLRFLGGSSGHWTGMCRPFEDIDFNRGYLGKHCKWPIKKKDLDPYLEEACEILEIDDNFSDVNMESVIRGINFNFSPPVRMGTKYRQFLEDSNISVFLNTNFTDASDKGHYYDIAASNYKKDNIIISSKKIIFAMGGIENSRFLLYLNSKREGQLFSKGLPIGEYWMEHPHFSLGDIIIENDKFNHGYIAVDGQLQKKASILNCGFRLNKLGGDKTQELIRDIACYAPDLGNRFFKQFDKNLLCGFKLRAAWEQEPLKYNRVELDSIKDRFDIPLPILHWKKTAQDFKTVRKSISILNNYLIKKDIGRIRLFDWLTNGEFDYPINDEGAGFHHMGGTRMHSSPKFGVVDSNCKIHGSKNIFIAGSSVFTTGGHNNPTLPIVQLSLRLADHLNEA